MENGLAWRDRWVAKLVQDLSAYSEGSCEDAAPQIISGEENYVILKVSLGEWTKLFSSVYTGADFCYPDDSDNVRWILQRAVECPVSICDLIIDCITNNPATLQAIIDGLQASEEFNDFISQKVEGLTIEALTGQLVYGSCDDAILAGKMLAMVNSLDANNTDAIEIVEVGTNDEEKIASILEGIPILGELPFGDIILFMQDVFEDLGENYLAASTTERREALARALWCYAQTKTDCALTYADLFTFFQDRVASGLTLESLAQNVVDWLVFGDFSTDDLVFDAFMAAQIAFVRVGKEFFGINMPKIGALTRDAEPSSIWEAWDPCEPVPPDPTCIDLTETETLWSIYLAIGEFQEGVGFKALNYSGNYYVYVQRAPDGTSNLFSRVKLTYTTPVTHINLGTSAGTYSYTGAAATEIIYDVETFPLWTDGVANSYMQMISHNDSGMTASTALIEACIEFYEP